MSVTSVAPGGSGAPAFVPPIPGLQNLWRLTRGDPRITVALVDGGVDASHPCLAGAALQVLSPPGRVAPPCRQSSQGSCRHGTSVASLVFGQHERGPIKGVAPGCRGLVIPVFRDHPLVAGGILPASQGELARAIDLARSRGAHIITISSGQLWKQGAVDDQLAAAVRRCAQDGVLIVAAAGNEGCDCHHVPAVLPGVLVVGALDRKGRPAEFSNYGAQYHGRGILAPGESLTVARAGGGYEVQSGTSYAAPLVAGAAALLLSMRGRSTGGRLSPIAAGELLVASARPCPGRDPPACNRYLAGTLDAERALALLGRGEALMTNPNADSQAPVGSSTDEASDANDLRDGPVEAAAVAPATSGTHSPRAQRGRSTTAAVTPSCKEGGCSCGGGGACKCGGGGDDGAKSDTQRPPLVYALGTLSYDFGTQARFDSIAAEIVPGGPAGGVVGPIPASIDTASLLAHLEEFPHVAESITWTLNLDATPIYAIRPDGAYAAGVYERLRQFLSDQVDDKVRAERVSLPGYLVGTQTLLTGQKVAVVVPELRGMFNWTIGALVERSIGKRPGDSAAQKDRDAFKRKESGLMNFLQRVYYEVRNLGLEPRDRALNYAATNAFQIQRLFGQAAADGLQLDQIDVDRSPVCRLDSDCWDVVLYFFNPANVLGEARRAFRFTVDASDVVPVLIGDLREWSVR